MDEADICVVEIWRVEGRCGRDVGTVCIRRKKWTCACGVFILNLCSFQILRFIKAFKVSHCSLTNLAGCLAYPSLQTNAINLDSQSFGCGARDNPNTFVVALNNIHTMTHAKVTDCCCCLFFSLRLGVDFQKHHVFRQARHIGHWRG